MPGSYVAFNLLPSDPFDLLASCIVSLTQRINKYVCMYVNRREEEEGIVFQGLPTTKAFKIHCSPLV